MTVEVEQGAIYQIDTPATAMVGPPSTFTMSISLVDSNGVPLPTANNWVTITALKSNLEPASSTLQVPSVQSRLPRRNQELHTVDAIPRIADVQVLRELALKDPDVSVRLAAMKRIDHEDSPPRVRILR